MSGLTTFPYGAQPLNPADRSKQIGLPSSQGDVIVIGEPFFIVGQQSAPQVCHHIHVGIGGNVLVQMQDGTINPWLGLTNGATIMPKAGIMVIQGPVTLADGNSYQTTASAMTWHGGQ